MGKHPCMDIHMDIHIERLPVPGSTCLFNIRADISVKSRISVSDYFSASTSFRAHLRIAVSNNPSWGGYPCSINYHCLYGYPYDFASQGYPRKKRAYPCINSSTDSSIRTSNTGTGTIHGYGSSDHGSQLGIPFYLSYMINFRY